MLGENDIELLATSIKIYSQDGEYTATHEFTDHLDAAHREEHITCSDHTTSNCSNNPALNIENKQMEQPTHETEGSLKTKIVENMDEAEWCTCASLSDSDLSTPDSATLKTAILPPVYNVETKLCKAIIKCINIDKDIKELDTLRKYLKTQKLQKHDKQYNEDMKKYRQLLAKVKRKIVFILQKSITEYEKVFFATTGRMPSKDEEIWVALVGKKNYASNLLQMWEEDI